MLEKPVLLLMVEQIDEDDMPVVVRQNFNQFVHVAWIGNFENGQLVPDWLKLSQSIIELAFQKHNGFK